MEGVLSRYEVIIKQGKHIEDDNKLEIPVSSHLDFFRENEVLNGGSVLQNLLPGPTTVFFDLAEVLRPK